MHAPWEQRLDLALRALQWVTLALGVFISFFRLGPTSTALTAAAVAGSYVIAGQVLPRSLHANRWTGEILAVAGVVLVAIAIGMSGGVESPYLLLSLVPVMFGAVRCGFRVGMETAALAAGALSTVATTASGQLVIAHVVAWGSLYLLIGASFSYARLLLVEGEQRAQALQEASAKTSARLQRLESAHRLLTRLSELADAAELNPVTVGQLALENLDSLVEYRAGTVALSGDAGPVVVARRDTPRNGHRGRLFLPLRVGEREVGLVVLARSEPFSQDERQLIEDCLHPVALAFANILLLQDIAKRAVREERTRLARELHDEIGPSLASLGLALDLALLQHPGEPALTAHLESLRHSVTQLVEEVRTTVSDLRHPDLPSMTEHLQGLVSNAPRPGPEVRIDLDERRPPRPSILSDLTAIVSEAFRNALRHAEAGIISVEGWIDYDRGAISVRDDGRGFDPTGVPSDRFGLIGLYERAQLIGARLDVASSPGAGTTVKVEWR